MAATTTTTTTGTTTEITDRRARITALSRMHVEVACIEAAFLA
jgi:hypothetical protein